MVSVCFPAPQPYLRTHEKMQENSVVSSKTIEAGMSASKRVYIELRQRIIEMKMLPGTRIVERDIAAEHGTSRTPVHEAVLRLAEEGLVEVVQRVGTFVARIPLNELEEAMLVRTALESAVIERAATRITDEGIRRLQTILKDQHECVQANDMRGFHQTDEAFHETLADIAGVPGVWKMIQQAKTQLDRYRRLTLPMPGRMDLVVGEHEAIVAALQAGEKQSAMKAMRVHLDDVLLPVVDIARTLRPDFFINHPAERASSPASW